jgi:hypothetical protein
MQKVSEGHMMHLSFGVHGTQSKAKIILGGEPNTTNPFQKASLLSMISALREVSKGVVSTDRGHRHSSGRSLIQMWMTPLSGSTPHEVTPEVTDERAGVASPITSSGGQAAFSKAPSTLPLAQFATASPPSAPAPTFRTAEASLEVLPPGGTLATYEAVSAGGAAPVSRSPRPPVTSEDFVWSLHSVLSAEGPMAVEQLGASYSNFHGFKFDIAMFLVVGAGGLLGTLMRIPHIVNIGPGPTEGTAWLSATQPPHTTREQFAMADEAYRKDLQTLLRKQLV